jgi:hypothetical protein
VRASNRSVPPGIPASCILEPVLGGCCRARHPCFVGSAVSGGWQTGILQLSRCAAGDPRWPLPWSRPWPRLTAALIALFRNARVPYARSQTRRAATAQAVIRLGQEQQMPWSGKNPMTVAGSIIWGVVHLEQVGTLWCVCVCISVCVCV